MLSSSETHYSFVKLFVLENPSIQYNPELTSFYVLLFLSLLDPNRDTSYEIYQIIIAENFIRL